MSSVVSVVTSPIDLMIKLHEIVKKYIKKKKTERRFVKAFENEVKKYIDIFEQVYELSEKEILPILDSIGDEFSIHEMNELAESFSNIPLIYANMINAFISFAKACSEVSAIRGFMEDLKDTNILLYDFVYAMKNIYVGENRVKISGTYYRFFKTYEGEILREVEINELKEIVGELKRYARKTKHYRDKTALIKRSTRKKIMKNFRVLAKASEKMSVAKTEIVDLKAYVPEKLLPIVVLIEELQ